MGAALEIRVRPTIFHSRRRIRLFKKGKLLSGSAITLNAEVAECEKEFSFFRMRAILLVLGQMLLGQWKDADWQGCPGNDDGRAAYRQSEETEKANDVENEIRTILSPLIRLVENFA